MMFSSMPLPRCKLWAKAHFLHLKLWLTCKVEDGPPDFDQILVKCKCIFNVTNIIVTSNVQEKGLWSPLFHQIFDLRENPHYACSGPKTPRTKNCSCVCNAPRNRTAVYPLNPSDFWVIVYPQYHLQRLCVSYT